jgi:uncharacterized protein (TIGR02246 family)
MKIQVLIVLSMNILLAPVLLAQHGKEADGQTRDIYVLIDNYSLARENKDTILLKKILTPDIDQLVSTGEWRHGINESVQGMLRSSATSPGTRTLTVEKVRFLDAGNAIADARYDIKNPDGTTRKMWSTFVTVKLQGQWKIAAIRNMLPTAQP